MKKGYVINVKNIIFSTLIYQINLSGKIVFILGLLLTFGSIELLNWMVTLKIGIVPYIIYALFFYTGLRVLFAGLKRMCSGD